MSLAYINHIDGLRAVAVVQVVMFHFLPTFDKGGYLGVDQFFVISGYLMTTKILTEINSSQFHFLHFLKKRFWRLYPSLFCIVSTTVLISSVVFDIALRKTVRKCAVSSLLFVSNFYFNSQTRNYFAQGADISPLLHTWSLSIEEQFYLLWPVFLMVISKPTRGIVKIGGIAQLIAVFTPA